MKKLTLTFYALTICGFFNVSAQTLPTEITHDSKPTEITNDTNGETVKRKPCGCCGKKSDAPILAKKIKRKRRLIDGDDTVMLTCGKCGKDCKCKKSKKHSL